MTEPRRIFVFGSNLRGFHGGGAARTARIHWGGYIRAVPVDSTWNSMLAPGLRDLIQHRVYNHQNIADHEIYLRQMQQMQQQRTGVSDHQLDNPQQANNHHPLETFGNLFGGVFGKRD